MLYHDAFLPEFEALTVDLQDNLLTMAQLRVASGPSLGRPHADTLAESQYANMEELRFRADDGVWRAAFAFDPERQAIVLVAGDKNGGAQKRFYKSLIAKADARFAKHLATVKG